MKKGLFTAALLFTCTLAFNQIRHSSMVGVVTDESGEALIGATVKLMKDNAFVLGAITDVEGNYAFKEVVPDMYNLEIMYTGYKTNRVENVEVKENKVYQLDVVLESQVMCCDCYFIWKYFPTLIDQNPGNTGTTYSAGFLRNMY